MPNDPLQGLSMRQRRLVGLALLLAALFMGYQKLHPAQLGRGGRGAAELLVALGAMLVALHSLRTGTIALFRGRVTRTDTPTSFWLNVLFNIAFAALFVGLGLRDILSR